MPQPIELQIDVTEAAGLGEPLHTAVSVVLPDPGRLREPPVVAFGFPGAGYSRGYYLFDMPGSSFGGEAGYHAAEHGWIFVACDHLGVGDSSLPDPDQLTLANVSAANGATVDRVMGLLKSGSLAPQLDPLTEPAAIGIGQSMGGCFTIYLQGSAPRFGGVAIMGYSAIHSIVPRPDGSWLTFDRESSSRPESTDRGDSLTWAFHYLDVPEEIVKADMTDYPTRLGNLPVWGSATTPGCVRLMPKPGVVSEQAAAIEVPVFIGVGEIDIVVHPREEPAAYSRAQDVTVHIHPKMAHMHNFAGNRTQLWDRLAAWVDGIAVTSRD